MVTERLAQLGVSGRALVVDVTPNENLRLAVQNLPRVRLVPTGQLTARDLIGSSRVVMSQAAVERLAQVLGS